MYLQPIKLNLFYLFFRRRTGPSSEKDFYKMGQQAPDEGKLPLMLMVFTSSHFEYITQWKFFVVNSYKLYLSFNGLQGF